MLGIYTGAGNAGDWYARGVYQRINRKALLRHAPSNS